MKIFFEECEYPIKRVQDTFENGLYSTFNNGESARLNAVGYYYSTKVNDSVFILPKVFLFEDEKKAFKRYDPLEIIDIDTDNNPLKENGDDAVIFELSTWIFLAIKQYNKRNSKNRISQDNLITNVKSTGDHHSATYLDIILSLRRFSKEHRNLFTFISIINSRGNHKINWKKTINNVTPFLSNNTPFYLEFKHDNKTINYDEELIKLFYSVLEYLKIKYRFKSHIDLNYDLLKPNKIESMIACKKGTRILKKIRHRFFKDELVALWNLLYTFFDKSEQIAAKNYPSETLLARQFNNVFEDMIDQLIGDEESSLPDSLKDQPDGKVVDHIYSDKSLLDDNLIYFIGDSKYYKDTTPLTKNSIYKQFTYAKNVIQINMNIFFDNKEKEWHKADGKELRYRDNLTEGYNITPNFFIRGNVDPNNLTYTDPQINSETDYKGDEIIRENYQFKDRLFDRDTLFTKEYNINFLYVLSAYAANADTKAFREETRKIFRDGIIDLLNGKKGRYNFYILEAKNGDLEKAINMNFRLLQGKIYRPSVDSDYVILALNREAMQIEQQQLKAKTIPFTLLDRIKPYFYRYEYNLGEDINMILEAKRKGRIALNKYYADADDFVNMLEAAEVQTPYKLETIERVIEDNAKSIEAIIHENQLNVADIPIRMPLENELILVGFFKGEKHIEQILKNKMYYVRTGQRPGSIHLVQGFDTCRYLFLHHKQTFMMFKLKGTAPRLFTGKQLKEKGFDVGIIDESYLAFDLASTELISFDDIDVKKAIIKGIGNRIADSYFTTLKELFGLK